MFNKTDTNTPTLSRCYLQAGHIAYSIDPACIYGVCGNGVIVTLYDPVSKCGGMVHCVFPEITALQKPSNYHSHIALQTLLGTLTRHGKISSRLEAHLFGGGNFCGMKKERAMSLIRRIRAFLDKMNVKVISEDVGGSIGRKIIFDTASGETIVYRTKNIRKTDWLPELSRR